DALDSGGRRGTRHGRKGDGGGGGEQQQALQSARQFHERFSSALTAVSLTRYPVTERVRSSHLRAASRTSAAVTARTLSDHPSTSSIDCPAARALPYQRAISTWLSS